MLIAQKHIKFIKGIFGHLIRIQESITQITFVCMTYVPKWEKHHHVLTGRDYVLE